MILFSISVFLQIKPPKEWSVHSQNIPDGYILQEVYEQAGERMEHGGFNIDVTKHDDMPASVFAAKTHESYQRYFGGRKPTIEEAEDLYWSDLCEKSKIYAMNNPLTLFGNECKEWNMDQFTAKDSLIHYEETHHNQQKVCILLTPLNKFFPLTGRECMSFTSRLVKNQVLHNELQ